MFQTIYCESCAILWCLPRQFLGGIGSLKQTYLNEQKKHFGVFSLLKIKCADLITNKYWKMGFVNVRLDHWALNIIEMKTKLGRSQGPFERFYYLNSCFCTLLLRSEWTIDNSYFLRRPWQFDEISQLIWILHSKFFATFPDYMNLFWSCTLLAILFFIVLFSFPKPFSFSYCDACKLQPASGQTFWTTV